MGHLDPSVARLGDLEALPIPFSTQDDRTILELATLYDDLADDAQQVFSKMMFSSTKLWGFFGSC